MAISKAPLQRTLILHQALVALAYMPSIVCRSRIRAASEHCTLSLDVRHHILAGKPSSSVYDFNKARFPDDIDVLLASNLVITLSGVSDGISISSEEIYASELSRHLVDFFQMNAAELGLNTVSKLEIDEFDGLPKLVLTPSRQAPKNLQLVSIFLVSIDLSYAWQSSDCSTSNDSTSHPFASKLSLPFKTLLDNVVWRFVTWQLVRRYPLIFGSWCKGLNNLLNTDRADDEYLSQDHIPVYQQKVGVFQALLWDDLLKDTATPTSSLALSWFPDTNFYGENEYSNTTELSPYIEYSARENKKSTDILPLQNDNRGWLKIHHITSSDDTLRGTEPIDSSPFLEFDYDDPDIKPRNSQLISPTERLESDDTSKSTPFCLFLNNNDITSEDDRDPQGSTGQALTPRYGYQVTSRVSLHSPSISASRLKSEEIEEIEKLQVFNPDFDIHQRGQLHNCDKDNTSIYDKKYTLLPRLSHALLDDAAEDMDLNILSDTSSSGHIETGLAQNRDLGGVSVDSLTRHSFPETSNSHHSPTLNITCSTQVDPHRQLSGLQDGIEEELWREGNLDLGDDMLTVIDF
ncbi:hypothetical protein H0H81_002305 [Sphagnurus paluster]|uniref:Uncharacterized protein n=1 Tax=Sphagnurus paluster TaxID=117069 RepID=A0A9P7K7S1_9AGAR|nr:hypothetical protein H0H81_002305 [Sphagnurus paluster]